MIWVDTEVWGLGFREQGSWSWVLEAWKKKKTGRRLRRKTSTRDATQCSPSYTDGQNEDPELTKSSQRFASVCLEAGWWFWIGIGGSH